MRHFSPLAFLFFASLTSFAQSIVFDDADNAVDFRYHKAGSKVVCFYKVWDPTPGRSHYRTVVLNSNLEMVDTINYRLPGEVTTILSGENDQYGYRIFNSKYPDRNVITFMVTDKGGNVIARYEKNAAELRTWVNKKVKPQKLKFECITTSGSDAGTLLLRPMYVGSGGTLKWESGLVGIDLLTGALKWRQTQVLNLRNAVCVEGKLVGIVPENDAYWAECFSLANGVRLSKFPLSPPKRNRSISLAVVNGSDILVGGTDTDSNDKANKHARFFLSRYGLDGSFRFDRIDTMERLSGNRLMMIGGTFTPEGNVVAFGESYRLDATKAVVGMAATVALTILTRGGYYANMTMPVEHVIENLVSARISQEGEVTEFHAFPVEKTKSFSTLIRDDHQVFFRNKNQLLLYDLNELASPPRKYTKLLPGDAVFTLYGNLIGIRMNESKKEIMLAVVPAD